MIAVAYFAVAYHGKIQASNLQTHPTTLLFGAPGVELANFGGRRICKVCGDWSSQLSDNLGVGDGGSRSGRGMHGAAAASGRSV